MIKEKQVIIKEINLFLNVLSKQKDICFEDEYLMSYEFSHPIFVGKYVMLGFNLPNVLVTETLIKFKKNYVRLPNMRVKTLESIRNSLEILIKTIKEN